MDMERDLWAAAGVVEGAVVADVGCGPGAMSVVLAGLVGPSGRVIAVDADADAVEAARAAAGRAGAGNVTVAIGDAAATGIEPASVDVVMIRHVLAHNGGREESIVCHAATLLRPGGCVYLADIDASGIRMRPSDPDVEDLGRRYMEWHAQRGNDLSVGLRLDDLLAACGLDVVDFQGRYQIFTMPPGVRPPGWAARDAMVEAGLAGASDLERWAAAFERIDTWVPPPTVFASLFFGAGRRP